MKSSVTAKYVFCGLFVSILTAGLFGAISSDHPLLWTFAVAIGFIVVCGIGVILNLIMFPPLFRLLSRLPDRSKETDHKVKDDHGT